MTTWQTRKWIQRKSGSERLALIRLSISIVLSFWLVQTTTSAAFGTLPETIVPKPGIIMFVTFENGTTKPVDDPGQPPTTSEGCAEGWGYYVDDPNPICEPLDAIGEGPPKDLAFCAALGCPYNPPNLSNPPPEPIPRPEPEPELKPQPDTSRNCTDPSQGFVHKLGPQEGSMEPEPVPPSEQPQNGDNNGENEGGNSNEEGDESSSNGRSEVEEQDSSK